jgi:hypothetical protein
MIPIIIALYQFPANLKQDGPHFSDTLLYHEGQIIALILFKINLPIYINFHNCKFYLLRFFVLTLYIIYIVFSKKART